MSNSSLINCSIISVDCVENDPVDVRCGGPKYLGFDFYVREKEAEQMKNFIVATLETFKVPLQSIYTSGTIQIEEKKVWTKERIVESIKVNAEYLQTEATRTYSHKR